MRNKDPNKHEINAEILTLDFKNTSFKMSNSNISPLYPSKKITSHL